MVEGLRPSQRQPRLTLGWLLTLFALPFIGTMIGSVFIRSMPSPRRTSSTDNEASDRTLTQQQKEEKVSDLLHGHCALPDRDEVCGRWSSLRHNLAVTVRIWSEVARRHGWEYDPWQLTRHTVATHIKRVLADSYYDPPLHPNARLDHEKGWEWKEIQIDQVIRDFGKRYLATLLRTEHLFPGVGPIVIAKAWSQVARNRGWDYDPWTVEGDAAAGHIGRVSELLENDAKLADEDCKTKPDSVMVGNEIDGVRCARLTVPSPPPLPHGYFTRTCVTTDEITYCS